MTELLADGVEGLMTLFDPHRVADPYPRYAWLRAARPVWHPVGRVYVLSRHGDCAAVLRDPDSAAPRRDTSGCAGSARAPSEEELVATCILLLVAGHETTTSLMGSAGSAALMLVGAANRDPALCADPDQLDVTRPPTRHVSFGQGIHFCLGAPLARLETQIVLRQLLQRPDDPWLAGEPAWKENTVLRGLRRLPVQFTGLGLVRRP